jgi:N6-L-threonylcarbamoyladenine synthase
MDLILGIETSCDETAAAVLEGDRVLRSTVVASQVEVHAPYGGIVPELASRRHIEVITPVIERALADAGVTLADLTAIAVTAGPGLVGSLLVGVSVAKAIAYCRRLPLVAVNHLEGHIAAARLESPTLGYPFVALVVSGGHTHLYHVSAECTYRRLGRTRDDAAGEAFDKVAKVLGLGYPGGPVIEREARSGQPGLQLQRPQDGGGAPPEGRQPRRAPRGSARPSRGPRHLRQLPTGGGGHAGRTRDAGGARNRRRPPGGGRRRGMQRRAASGPEG